MYDAKTQKAVSWDIGQDVNFVHKFFVDDKDVYPSYDKIMIDSFRFME
jgi:hypothetical protein